MSNALCLLFTSAQQVLETCQILSEKMVAADFLQNGQRLKARRQKVIPANMFLHLAALPWRNVFHLLLNLVPDDHSKLFSVGPFHVVLSWQKSYSQKSKNQDD